MRVANKTWTALVIGAFAVATVACGGDDTDSAQEAVAPTTTGVPATDVSSVPTMPPPTPVEDETTIAELAAQYDGLGTDAGPGAFPRTVRHAAGSTEVAARPERVVTLDSGQRDALMALGITPVGMADGSNDPEALADVPRVGLVGEPNFEAIAALDPDLILTNESRTGGMYDQLASIAPTVSGIQGGGVWKHDFDLAVAALGEERAAESLRQRYTAQAEKVAALAAAAGSPEVSLVRLRADDLRVYLRSSYAGVVLDDAGLLRPADHNADANHRTISFEELAQIDADIVLIAADKDVTTEQLTDLRSQPLWTALSAAQRDQIHDVDSATWIAGGGYYAALSMLDDLERLLGEYQPA